MTTSLVAITGNTFPVKNPEDFRTWLAQRHACWEALEWLQERDAATAWSECPRGDWLLWWAAKVGVERKVVVLAACACARLALPYVAAGELRPLKAIETAEAWYSGKASLGDVRAAYAADDASAAAAAAAYAAAAARDKSLADFAEGVVQILIEMKAPGCQWLALTEAPR